MVAWRRYFEVLKAIFFNLYRVSGVTKVIRFLSVCTSILTTFSRDGMGAPKTACQLIDNLC